MILRRLAVCLLVFAILSWAPASAAPPANGPGVIKPAPSARPGDDRWLANVLLAELERFSATGEYDELATRTAEAILARLATGKLDKLDTLSDLVYVLRACRYLPLAAETDGGKDFAAWLVDNRPIARRMFRAMADVPWPKIALASLHELQAAEAKAVAAYPELAVAFASSRAMRHYREQEAPMTMVESFRWYTAPRTPFRYDLKLMPYELSRFLASTRLSLVERKWAVNTYRKHKDPARTYFDLKYDDDYYQKGVPKKISKLPYTLQNLRKVGGVCIDQGYYAAEICKAMGIPAVIVTGEGSSGIGHAWLARLKISRGGRSARWDTQTGRYQAHQYFSGDVTNPATGRSMHDSELTLAGAAAQLSLARREHADAAVLLAKMVDKAHVAEAEADLSVLAKLAATYNEAMADKRKHIKVAPVWSTAARKLDGKLVEDLIAKAIDRNLAERPAWELIIKLRKADRLDAKHLGRFFDTLVTKTAKSHPEYSCRMVMRIVPTIKDTTQRVGVYKRSLGVYGFRPDLQGKLLIALADDYRDRDVKDKALAMYGKAASECINVPEVVLKATKRAEELLAAMDQTGKAIQMYMTLFSKTRPEKTASAFQQQTSHYQLGKRLAELLEAAGRAKDAAAVRAKIGMK